MSSAKGKVKFVRRRKPEGNTCETYVKVAAIMMTMLSFVVISFIAMNRISEEQAGNSKLFLRNRIEVVRTVKSIPKAVLNLEVSCLGNHIEVKPDFGAYFVSGKDIEQFMGGSRSERFRSITKPCRGRI
jgi:hypothetical protein